MDRLGLQQNVPACRSRFARCARTAGRGFVFAGGEAAPGLGGALDSSQAPPLLGDCTNTSYTMSW